MIIFRSDAGPAVYSAFIGFQHASSTTPVESTILALAEPDACTASFLHVLCEKESRKGRHQTDYTDTFGKLLRSDITQLVQSVRQLT